MRCRAGTRCGSSPLRPEPRSRSRFAPHAAPPTPPKAFPPLPSRSPHWWVPGPRRLAQIAVGCLVGGAQSGGEPLLGSPSSPPTWTALALGPPPHTPAHPLRGLEPAPPVRPLRCHRPQGLPRLAVAPNRVPCAAPPQNHRGRAPVLSSLTRENPLGRITQLVPRCSQDVSPSTGAIERSADNEMPAIHPLISRSRMASKIFRTWAFRTDSVSTSPSERALHP